MFYYLTFLNGQKSVIEAWQHLNEIRLKHFFTFQPQPLNGLQYTYDSAACEIKIRE